MGGMNCARQLALAALTLAACRGGHGTPGLSSDGPPGQSTADGAAPLRQDAGPADATRADVPARVDARDAAVDPPAPPAPLARDAAAERTYPPPGRYCELGGDCCPIVRDGGSMLGCFGDGVACDRRAPGGRTCVRCGEPGGPCCESGPRCHDPADVCITHLIDGTLCGRCGGDGELCCDGQSCKNPTSWCNYPAGVTLPPKRCFACGEELGPCCDGTRCNRDDLVCTGKDGGGVMCRKCGVAGGPCCAGNRCSDGSCCFSISPLSINPPTCLAPSPMCNGPSPGPLTCGASASCAGCGGQGQPCCGQPGDSENVRLCVASGTACLPSPDGVYRCSPCGQSGQPCCKRYESFPQFPQCAPSFKCQETPQGPRCEP